MSDVDELARLFLVSRYAIERGLARELSAVAGRDTVDLAALEEVDPLLARRYREARERYRHSRRTLIEPRDASVFDAMRQYTGAASRS